MALQINIHRNKGRFYKVRRFWKKQARRERRRIPIQEDDFWGKGIQSLKCIKYWVD